MGMLDEWSMNPNSTVAADILCRLPKLVRTSVHCLESWLQHAQCISPCWLKQPQVFTLAAIYDGAVAEQCDTAKKHKERCDHNRHVD